MTRLWEMFAAALAHIEGGGDVPYALGTCVNCGAVQVAWSEYQWALLVRMPCRSCGKPCEGGLGGRLPI